jgi:hypothetical protein
VAETIRQSALRRSCGLRFVVRVDGRGRPFAEEASMETASGKIVWVGRVISALISLRKL